MSGLRLLFCLCLLLLFISPARSSSSSTSVYILGLDQNPPGRDAGREWVAICNSGEREIKLEGWSLWTNYGRRGKEIYLHEVSIPPRGIRFFFHSRRWLKNEKMILILRDERGFEIDRSPELTDEKNDNRFWMRTNEGWIFGLQEFEPGGRWKGEVKEIISGNTILFSPLRKAGLQAVRLAGVEEFEPDSPEEEKAIEIIRELCEGREAEIDVDDERPYDEDNRVRAVIFIEGSNLNLKLIERGFGSPLPQPPSEFIPYPDFTFSPEIPRVGRKVSFDASPSWTLDPSAPIIFWRWDFGDGTSGEGEKAFHLFDAPGKYRIELQVEDAGGRKNKRIKELRVFPDLDLNKNGRVESGDLVVIARNFNSPSTTPPFDLLDLNLDGFIDIYDLVILGENFGIY